jgi:hypothetical protein
MTRKAIIVAPNPHIVYQQCNTNEPGDVEAHRLYRQKSARSHGMSFLQEMVTQSGDILI